MNNPLKEIPSLSRLLDIHLTAEVVEGPVTTMDYMKFISVSIPTEDYTELSGADIEILYLRPMIEALANSINEMGRVRTRALPEPKDMVSFSCTNGRVPVTLTLARRSDPDRHVLSVYALVQPEDEE